MKKKIIAIFCSLFILTTLAACSEDTSSSSAPSERDTSSSVPESSSTSTSSSILDEELPLIAQGIFSYTLKPEGREDYFNYFHFYPNGVYYASMYNGTNYSAGFYEILDEPMMYKNDADDETEAEAPQTIVMTDTKGNVYERVAYDAEKGIIGDVQNMYTLDFNQDFETEHTSADENGVALYEFMLGDDTYSMVRLMHNSTFEDTISTMVEGTWDIDGDVVTLADGDTGKTYTLTIAADGTKAEYVGLDGSTKTLNRLIAEAALLTFKGAGEGVYGEMAITIELYEDGTLKQITDYANNTREYEGTWEMAESQTEIFLKITQGENAVEYTAVINMDDHSFSFDFTTSDSEKEITFPVTTAE